MNDLEDLLNLTNKRSHPTNTQKVVYRHIRKDQAEYFRTLLLEHNISFEAQVDEEDPRKPEYFGVAKAHEKAVERLNYLAIGHQREKFIPTASLRWFVIIIAFAVLALAVVGAIVSM